MDLMDMGAAESELCRVAARLVLAERLRGTLERQVAPRIYRGSRMITLSPSSPR